MRSRASVRRSPLRAGSLLQVRDAPGLADRVQRLPGVRGVGPADVAVPDQVISQGVERIGADALQSHGLTGAGIRIAIVDLGFGPSWRSLLGKELPPLTQIDATSRSTTPAASPTSRASRTPTSRPATARTWPRSCGTSPRARATRSSTTTRSWSSRRPSTGSSTGPTASRASTSWCTRTRSSTVPSTAPASRRRPSTARTTRASSGPTRPATTRAATGRASPATPTRTAGRTSARRAAATCHSR